MLNLFQHLANPLQRVIALLQCYFFTQILLYLGYEKKHTICYAGIVSLHGRFVG